MLRLLVLFVFIVEFSFGVDLGSVDVNAQAQQEEIEEGFSEVFEEPEYFEGVDRVESMPSQKRVTTKEAMFIPGVQGDPIKSIQSLSGVTSLNDSTGELFIYGSKPEETITTINYLPIGYLFHAGGLHSVVSPDAIEQIDAYLAGFDATYGDAMGGVINITPKYPQDEYKGYIHLGLYDSSFGVTAPISEKASIYIGARRSYFDLVLAAIGRASGTLSEDTNTTYTEFPNYYDGTLIAKYAPDSNNIFSAELITSHDALDIYSQANKVKDPEAVGQIKADYGFTTIGARHQGFYRDYESNTLLYYKHQRDDVRLFDGYFVDTESHESGFFHKSTFTAFDSHKLVGGVEIKNTFTPSELNISTPPSPENPNYDFTTEDKFYVKETISTTFSTLFLEDIFSATEKFVIRYGARFNYTNYNNLNAYIDPRLSLLYRLDSSNNISFATGLYTQAPQGYRFVRDVGNPYLGYERAEHYVLHYDNSYFENITFNIDGFYKKYQDLIVEDSASRFSNSGSGYAYGIDTNVKMRYDNYYLYGAYTYMSAKRSLEASDSTLYRFYGEIPHTLQIIAGKRFWKNWALSTRMNYRSGNPYTRVIGTYDDNGRLRPIYEDPFSSRLPEYFSLNVKVSQEIKLSKNESLEWSFEIMNLTNNQNVTDVLYDDEYNIKGYREQLPLLPWFDVTYRF